MRLKIFILLTLLLFTLGILGFAPVHVPINDKLLHTLAFATTALVLYHLWDLGLARNLLLTTTVMLLLSVGSEVVQGFLPVWKDFFFYPPPKKKKRKKLWMIKINKFYFYFDSVWVFPFFFFLFFLSFFLFLSFSLILKTTTVPNI